MHNDLQQIQPQLDWNQILDTAFELGEQISRSESVLRYQINRDRMNKDIAVQNQIRSFDLAKQEWEETERFGIYHPSYQNALTRVQVEQDRLEGIQAVSDFKNAESSLDDLLFQISKVIASAVSEDIKVPGNRLELNSKGCGGSCNGGCG